MFALLNSTIKSVLTPSCKLSSFTTSVQKNNQYFIEYDQSLMENVICIRSDINAEPILRLPRDNRPLSALNIKQSLFILQVQLSDVEHFAIHLFLRQSVIQTIKLIISTSVKVAERERLSDGTTLLKLPLIVPRKRWIQILFHIPGIIEFLFKEQPVTAVDAVHIAGYARLRSLMTSDDELSCINSTPAGFALFAVPAYTSSVWVTGKSVSLTNCNCDASRKETINIESSKELIVDKNVSYKKHNSEGKSNNNIYNNSNNNNNKCFENDVHDILHANMKELEENSLVTTKNKSKQEYECNKNSMRCTNRLISVQQCERQQHPSTLPKLCLPTLKEIKKSEHISSCNESVEMHKEENYKDSESLSLSEETNTVSSSNSSKSSSRLETQKEFDWEICDISKLKQNVRFDHGNVKNALTNLEEITSSSNYVNTLPSTNVDSVVTRKSNTVCSSVNASYMTPSQEIGNNKMTHSLHLRNARNKSNETYIKIFDAAKSTPLSEKENTEMSVRANYNTNGKSKHDVSLANINVTLNISEWEEAKEEVNNNFEKINRSNKHAHSSTNKNGISANELINRRQSSCRNKQQITKQRKMLEIDDVQRIKRKCADQGNWSGETVSKSTNLKSNVTNIACSSYADTNNVTTDSSEAASGCKVVTNITKYDKRKNNNNDSRNSHTNSNTCTENVFSDKTDMIIKKHLLPLDTNKEIKILETEKREQRQIKSYDVNRRHEQKEQEGKKKLLKWNKKLKMLRGNTQQKIDEFIYVTICKNRASNIPVHLIVDKRITHRVKSHELHTSSIKTASTNDSIEFLYGYGIGYQGALNENGVYRIDDEINDDHDKQNVKNGTSTYSSSKLHKQNNNNYYSEESNLLQS